MSYTPREPFKDDGADVVQEYLNLVEGSQWLTIDDIQRNRMGFSPIQALAFALLLLEDGRLFHSEDLDYLDEQPVLPPDAQPIAPAPGIVVSLTNMLLS